MNVKFPRRIFYSILVILLWLGFVVDGTHALFSSAVVLATNTITTGTANLLISNSQNSSSTLFDTSRNGFAFNLIPGQSDQRYFFLKNVSSGSVDYDISLSAAITPSNTFDSAVKVSIYPVDETGTILPLGFTTTLQGISNKTTDTGFILAHSTTQRYLLQVSLDSSVQEQSASLAFDLTFTGSQVLPPGV